MPTCSNCGKAIWGNFGDGKWRHWPTGSILCKGMLIKPSFEDGRMYVEQAAERRAGC